MTFEGGAVVGGGGRLRGSKSSSSAASRLLFNERDTGVPTGISSICSDKEGDLERCWLARECRLRSRDEGEKSDGGDADRLDEVDNSLSELTLGGSSSSFLTFLVLCNRVLSKTITVRGLTLRRFCKKLIWTSWMIHSE